jgi:hypothetical protein
MEIPTPRTNVRWNMDGDDNAEAAWKWAQQLECENLVIREAANQTTSINIGLQAENERLRLLMVRIYNSGYHAGHHDTVEAGYVDIHDCDMDTYHAETVEDILSNNQITNPEK